MKLRPSMRATGTAALAAFPLFAPVLFLNRLFSGFYVPLFHVYFFAAQKYLIHDLGVAPTWWPHFFSGYPIGLTLDGFWNPIFIVALKFLPALPAYHWLTFAFFLVNIASCYAFARALRLSAPASLLAAVAYGFSGIIMRWTDVIVFTTMFPLLPLSFLAVLRIQEGDRRWWWMWSALLAYGWIAGFAELMVYFLLGTAGFCLVLLHENGGLRLSRWHEAAKRFLLPVVVSVLVVSPWLVSVLYFVMFHSNRAGGVALDASASMPISLSYLVHLFLPRLSVYAGENLPILRLGDDIDLFLGTVPVLLLATLPFTWRKRPDGRRTFFVCLFIFAFLMSFRSPLYAVVHALPILNWFRWHFKWSFLTVFAAAILAGYAMDSLETFFAHRAARTFLLVAWSLFGVGVAASAAAAVFAKTLISRIVGIGVSHIAVGTTFTRSPAYYERQITHIAESLIHGIAITNLFTAVAFALWGIALLSFTIPRLRRYLLAAALLGSSVVWWGFLTGQPASYLTSEPATAAFLHAQNAYRRLPITGDMAATRVPYRIYTFFPNETLAYLQEKTGVSVIDSADGHAHHQLLTRELLSENINTWFEIDGSWNNEPLVDAKTMALHELVPGREPIATSTLDEVTARFSTEKTARLLGGMNVKYVLTPLEISGPWKLVFTSNILDGRVPVRMYENPFFLPRWYFADHVEPSATTTVGAAANPADAMSLERYTAGSLTLKTKTTEPRWVVFSETGAPFWRGRIDGRDAPLARANVAYQALLVPPGSHEVEFYVLDFWQEARVAIGAFTGHL